MLVLKRLSRQASAVPDLCRIVIRRLVELVGEAMVMPSSQFGVKQSFSMTRLIITELYTLCHAESLS